ncbi:MAG TPA: CueP family metal-binding protein [Arachnia sp.]|nr:CueP family metal-binding protein [Arachnia sp.]HMT85010.1 CueP family metal-binding protein [Arachnia sp.]
MRIRIAAAAALTLAAGLVLSGCATDAPGDNPGATVTTSAPDGTEAGDAVLADHGLDGLDARGIIERLDTLPLDERPDDLMASIRPTGILLTDGQQRETTVPLPEDELYVSLAPYVEQTHDCHFHSLTTCTGELRNADVQVTVTDAAGAVIVDEALTTYDNGFVGLWLPRGLDGTLTVAYDGLVATSPISTTGDEAATCVTTLPLA